LLDLKIRSQFDFLILSGILKIAVAKLIHDVL